MKKYAIGIDLGQTHTRIALVNKTGKIKVFRKLRTSDTSQGIIKAIKKNIEDILSENKLNFSKDILGIGVAVASPGVNPKDGRLVWNKSLPFSKRFNLLNVLKKEFNKPVFIDNDLNATVIAEAKIGCLKKIKNGVVLTCSTGVGAGIILNGDIYRGLSFNAGEVGHMIVNPLDREFACNTGHFGDPDGLASARSVEKRYFKKSKKRLEAKEIVKLAKKGDRKALKSLKETAFWLGITIYNIINILDPECIVIYGNFFLESWSLIKKELQKNIQKSFNPKISVKKTKLGDNGGILGAAFLVFYPDNPRVPNLRTKTKAFKN